MVCAASELAQAAIIQSSAASLLPGTSHAHSSPEQNTAFPPLEFQNFAGNSSAAILLFTFRLGVLDVVIQAGVTRPERGGNQVRRKTTGREQNPTALGICYTFERYP